MKETECFGDWVVTSFGPLKDFMGPEDPHDYPDGLGDDDPYFKSLNI